MRLLVDSASLWYRAFYGMPETLLSPRGEPINAIKGFFDGFSAIVARYRPTEIALCLDGDWRPGWRVELFPAYKANRLDDEGDEAEPDLLTPQIEPLLHVAKLAGLSIVEVDSQEADDVIASLAVKAPSDVRVMTGDRDLFQLIRHSEMIRIIYLAKGIQNHDLVDRAYIESRYGIPAHRYHLFAAIRGDASDGLPGIKGIGEKGAAEIVAHFDSMAEVMRAADASDSRLRPLHQRKLLADRDYAKIAEQLVTCRTDLELNDAGLASWRERADLISLRKFGKELGLGSTLERLVATLDLT
ncbi:MAG: 5'-3' exonuclease H3TH domain-containing protein [Actinomycetota bacterium]